MCKSEIINIHILYCVEKERNNNSKEHFASHRETIEKQRYLAYMDEKLFPLLKSFSCGQTRYICGQKKYNCTMYRNLKVTDFDKIF